MGEVWRRGGEQAAAATPHGRLTVDVEILARELNEG